MAVRTISTKLAVDGEAQFKQAITACNSQLSLLKSSLAATESEFRSNANSLDALRAKDEKLSALKEAQTQKIQKLKEALENCLKATSKYAEQQAELEPKVKASSQAISELDAASQKSGKRWADYAQEVEKSEKSLEALKKKSGDTSAEQEKLEAVIAKAREEMGKLESSTDGAARQAGELILENRKLNEAFSENAARLDAATHGANNWEKQLNNATIEANRLDDALAQNNQYLKEAESSADGCAKSIDQYGKAVKDAGDASEDFGNASSGAIEQLAQAIVAAGLAEKVQEVAAALYDCVETFASFESQMSTVQAISGASGNELAALADKAKYMGSTTSFTATEAGQALEYMAMAGWKTGDMLDGLEGIMHLAAASGESLGSTSDIVTDALTAFGLAAADSAHFADVLAKASSNSNTNVQMMGETFKYAAPVAGALGYSIEDTALAIGLMANAGIKGSQSGTALRGMLTNLAKPSDEVASYMKRLGISLTDSSGQMLSLSSLMAVLRDRFSSLTEAQKAEYAAGLAGKEAMSGLLAIVSASDQDFRKLSAAINDCSGAAYDMSQVRLDNYAGQVTLLDSALDGLKLTIGSQLSPVLKRMAEGATTAVGGLTELLEACPVLTSLLAGLIASVGLLTTAFAGFSILQAVTPMIVAFNAALAANPAGLVAVGIAGVVTVVGSLISYFADAKDAASELNQQLEEIEGSYQDTSSKALATATAAGQLISKLEALERQESMTEGEAALYAQTVDKLRALLPDVSFEIDEQTGKLKGGAAAVRDMTEAWKEQALAQALQDKYQAVLSAQADALVAAAEKQLAYNDALATYTDIERQVAECEAEIDRVVSDSSLTDDERFQKLGELTSLQIGLTAQYYDANAALQEQEAILESSNEAAQAFDEEIQRLNEVEGVLTEGNRQNTESYEIMEASIQDLIATTQELETAYQESYFSAYDNISKQVSLFQELDGTAKTSIDNLIEALKNQVSYMETYAENIQKAMELGVDHGLIQKLSDGSEESAQILAAIVQGGEEDIAALNEQLAKVEEGKRDFSKTVAEMETDFNNQMKELVKDLDNAIQDMNVRDDAYKIGINNMQGLINGTASQKDALVRKYAEMGRAALEAYKREVQQHSPSRAFFQAGSFDIQGIIKGAESEKEALGSTYADMARTALDAVNEAMRGAQPPFYTPEVDYSALMMEAKSLDEFLERASRRTAKILNENILTTENGYETNAELLEQWLARVERSADEFEKSVNGITYQPEVDYSSLMLAAKSLEEFEELAAQRSAKIIGENIDMVAQGYASNEQLLEQWKQAVAVTSEDIERTVQGIDYDPDVDYSSLMLAAETLEEFEKLAAQRTAKIVGEHIDIIASGYADNAKLLEQWRNTVKQTMDSIAKAVNGISYDPDVDYSSLMLTAKDLEEFQKLAAQRSAKIIGENIDMVAQGYASNEQLLEQWNGAVQDSSNTVVGSVSKMEAEFTEKMEALKESMSFAEEAYKTGADNIRGYIEGAASMQNELVKQYAEMGRAAAAAYAQEIQQGKFEAAYTDLAQSAKDGAETFLPPTKMAFRPVGQDQQTEAIVSALSQLVIDHSSSGQSFPSAADIGAAVREALTGMGFNVDGRRFGQLVDEFQSNNDKAWGR